jgi:SAM-dependent methyltransferase
MTSASAVRVLAGRDAKVAPGGVVRSQNDLSVKCPECRLDLHESLPLASGPSTDALRCARCGFRMQLLRGVWHALPFHRERHYERFIREYEKVRAREGRGTSDATFYLALPFKDLTGRHSSQWSIRSRSFAYIVRRILPNLERSLARPLVILDLGAGNGWLSYRLTQRGHFCIAVDLLTNELDGLGAARHYSATVRERLTCFRAEADRLPFADAQCDCVIFNASFHYSEDYSRTLGEALRCLRPGGSVVIADSPWYSREEHGAQMVQERREKFTKDFGFPSDGLASQEYLTDERMEALASTFGIHWTMQCPWYGVRWWTRPWVARWNGRREPSEFRIYTTKSRIS